MHGHLNVKFLGKVCGEEKKKVKKGEGEKTMMIKKNNEKKQRELHTTLNCCFLVSDMC